MIKLGIYLEILAIVSVICLFGTVYSDDVCHDTISTKGRHFVVTVPPIVSDSSFNLSISIASLNSGYATVRQYDGSSSTQLGNYSLSPGEAEIPYIQGPPIRQYNEGKQTKVIEISASVDVTVHITGYVGKVAASFIAWPVESLTNEYSIPSFTTRFAAEYNYVQITSIHNNSFITVNQYSSPKSSMNATLSNLESYTLKSTTDPRQARVLSNNPINVVVGSICAIIKNASNCDKVYDSPIPVKYWGTAFVIPPLIPKHGYALRIYSKIDNGAGANVEYLYGNTYKSLHVQDMAEVLMKTEPTVMKSDKPINVVQYGFTENNEAGDAFMTSVPAITHYSKDYVFGTPFSDKNFTFRLTITIAQGLYTGLLLDNRNITEYPFVGKWSPNSLFSNYYDIITLKIKPGSHVLRHKNSHVTFAALLYGLKYEFGFGHSLGFSIPINKNITCYNGGSCTFDGRCVCPYGYTGVYCEHNLQPTETRGPYCLGCRHINDPKACDFFITCGLDELCHIEKLPNGTNTIYHLGCKPKNECAIWNEQDENVRDVPTYDESLKECEGDNSCHGNQAEHTLRSTSICKMCCKDDFCNKNCTVNTNNPQTIVG